jgi:hypothetical protein
MFSGARRANGARAGERFCSCTQAKRWLPAFSPIPLRKPKNIFNLGALWGILISSAGSERERVFQAALARRADENLSGSFHASSAFKINIGEAFSTGFGGDDDDAAALNAKPPEPTPEPL